MKPRMAALGLVVALAIAACSGGDDSFTTTAAAATTVVPTARNIAGSNNLGEGFDAGVDQRGQLVTAVQPVLEPLPSFDAKVIRDATLELRVEEGSFEQRWQDLRTLVADLGGYIGGANTSSEEIDGKRYLLGSATLKIPAQHFEEAIKRASAFGERITLNQLGEDVTEEFFDLEARRQHWEAEEAFYLQLMAKATTIDEAVTVRSHLQQVQATIEQIEGRLRYLGSRTDFATLTVSLTEIPADVINPIPVEPSEVSRAFDEARRVLVATFAFLLVAAAIIVPVSLIGLTVLGVTRIAMRVARRRHALSES